MNSWKDRYDFELARKDKLTDALTLPVGVLTVLGGSITYMAQSFSWSTALFNGVFSVVVILDVVAFTACLSFLARAYHAQVYVYLPTLKALHEAEGDLVEFYESVGLSERDARASFQASFEERIIEAADANTASNDRRSSLLHHSRLALFAVLALTASAVIPYVADRIRS